MQQGYDVLGAVAIVSRPGETITLMHCHSCGGGVVDIAEHDAFHERLGDGPVSREQLDRVKFGTRRIGTERGVQVGDRNTQNNVFGSRP